MAGDIHSLPHSKNKSFKHVYVCARAPNLSVTYERKGQIKETKGIAREIKTEKSLGFIKMSVGGVFQTNDDDQAACIEGLDWFGRYIKKVTHDELTQMLLKSGPEAEKVSTGPLGTMAGSKPAPVAPAEEAPREPAAAAIRGIGAKNS